ncbi:hypothetical protein KZ810_01225 [Sphingomonas sp. RHCKR47]|uniref:hypothetical protein n=1 Tax=Sphingomonas citricola TaxID=2862498 RepID=UPI001CA5A286|nr:hypothetical protein [Sphingomonas citricola]MBW6522109.1 hypothetical protein [Sphingomonas citricola]
MTAHPPAPALPAPALPTPADHAPADPHASAQSPSTHTASTPTASTHAPPRHHPPSRHDGWTPERQRTFVEAIAGGDTVDQACRRAGMTASAAYAFRRRAGGAAFALAWDGARLLARDQLADTLLTRALEGQEEVITRPDGSVVTRFRHDNRLAQHMLHRLDRFSDAASDSAHGTAARVVAGEFDAFLDLIDQGASPARAGLFLAPRLAPVSAPSSPAPGPADLARDLAPSPRSRAPTATCRAVPGSPPRSTSPISTPPRARTGAPTNGPVPRPPASSRSHPLPPLPRLRPRARENLNFLNFASICRPSSVPPTAPTPSGGATMSRRGGPASPRPTISTEPRTATGATATISAASPPPKPSRSNAPPASTPRSATSPKPASATNGSPTPPAHP